MSPRLVMLYSRSRGLGQSIFASLALALGTAVLAPVLIPVLLTSGRVSVGTPELFGALPAVVIGATFRRNLGEMEWVTRSRLRYLQGVHVLIAAVVSFSSCIVVTELLGPQPRSLLAATNGFSFLGLVLIVVRWNALPYWCLAVSVAGLTYLLGKNPDTGTVHSWAWLLWESGDGIRLLLNVALLLIGALSFLMLPLPPEEDA
jgi:hypothetical protein